MTNIGHFRAADKLLEAFLEENDGSFPTCMWVTPPTKIDSAQLKSEGCFNIYDKASARVETPGCSLCIGNQTRVGDNTRVLSTSTHNFPTV